MGTGTITISNSGFVMLWANTGSYAGSVTIANNFVLNTVGGDQIAAPAHRRPAEGRHLRRRRRRRFARYILTGTITLAVQRRRRRQAANNTLIIQGQITGPGGPGEGPSDAARDGNSVVTLTNTTNNYPAARWSTTGTLQQGASGVVPYGPSVGDMTVNSGATFDLAGFDAPLNGLWGTGTVTNSATSGSNLLTVGNNNATSTFGGVIQNPSGPIIAEARPAAAT